MCQERQRLEDCAVGDYVKCSNAIEIETLGNTLMFKETFWPDLNQWKFERRLMSRIVAVPPPPSESWSSAQPPIKVETFMVWARVN